MSGLMFTRREFNAALAAAVAAGAMSDSGAAAKEPLAKWKLGELQVHFLYAGSSESVFVIMPDGTTMLVDCGDYDCGGDLSKWNPMAPLKGKGIGEFTADYIRKVNPSGRKVDYWMLSHWHADHGGCETSYTRRGFRDGEVWYYSGLAELIDYLDFGMGFDRCWPNMGDPFQCPDTTVRQFAHIARTYRWMEKHCGFRIEKFRVGADDQVKLLKDPAAFPDFRIENICGNGVIRTRDGGTKNLYADFKPQSAADVWRRENGFSLGFIARYGKFRLYSAGDFQDFWKKPDGTDFQTEDELAAELDAVDVAKTNHHASDSMTPALIKALKAKVYVTMSVSGYSNWPTTMARLTDPKINPVDSLYASTYFNDTPKHVVVTVPRGGENYRVDYIAAGDDGLNVFESHEFQSRGGGA